MRTALRNGVHPSGSAPLPAARLTARRKILWIVSPLLWIGISHSTLSAQAVEPETQQAPAPATQAGGSLNQTRQERLRQMREDKAKDVVPAKQGKVEKYALKLDQKGNDSLEDVNFWGFHPRVDWIDRGSGIALGVRYWKPEALGSIDVMGAAFYSRKQYQRYELQVGMIPNRGKRIPPRKFETEEVEQLGDITREGVSKFKLYGSGRFRDRTDQPYYGQGPNTLQQNVAYYGVKDTLFEAVTGYQVTNHIGLTFKTGLLQNSLGPGRSDPQLASVFPESAVPAKATPPNYLRYTTSVLFDFRDDPGVPHRGFMVAFEWEKYDNVNTQNLFNFNAFGWDARGFIPLGSRQRVLALRAVAVDSDPSPGNLVPFFLQPSLGGGESLRGYDAFRYQGDKLLLLQGEYRWEASRRFELAVFGDTGTVADQGMRLSIHELKSDAGIGFRLKSSRSVIFRIDQAWGQEGAHTQFRFTSAF